MSALHDSSNVTRCARINRDSKHLATVLIDMNTNLYYDFILSRIENESLYKD